MSILSKESPSAIATELGRRLKQARLNANLSQAELAKRAGINRNTVLNAERGQVHLETFVALLQALGMAEQIDLMLPEPAISPLQLMKLKGKQRKRASRKNDSEGKEESQW